MVPHIALQGKKKKPSSSAQTRPAVKNEGKESEKIIYGTESFCCTPETLQISYTSIKMFNQKYKNKLKILKRIYLHKKKRYMCLVCAYILCIYMCVCVCVCVCIHMHFYVFIIFHNQNV